MSGTAVADPAQRTLPALPPDKPTIEKVSADSACRGCQGRQRYIVKIGAWTVGYLVSDYPWMLDISDDPTTHPGHPHYEMEWTAEDVNGRLLEVDVASLYYAAGTLRRLAAAGDIDAVRG